MPETVGPRARDREAVEEANPLIEPSESKLGAEFVSKIALAGYAIVLKVHFQMTTTYMPAMCRSVGSSRR